METKLTSCVVPIASHDVGSTLCSPRQFDTMEFEPLQELQRPNALVYGYITVPGFSAVDC